jgi:hypothetical protein
MNIPYTKKIRRLRQRYADRMEEHPNVLMRKKLHEKHQDSTHIKKKTLQNLEEYMPIGICPIILHRSSA